MLKIFESERPRVKTSLFGLLSLALVITLYMYGTSTNALAERIYKWVDESGKVHYGSQRPKDADSERLKINIDKPTPPPVNDKTKGDEKDKGKDDKTKDKDKKPDAKNKKKEPPKMSRAEKNRLCRQARSQKSTIESHGRLRERDAKGNVNYVSDKQKQSRLAAARKNIRKYCR